MFRKINKILQSIKSAFINTKLKLAVLTSIGLLAPFKFVFALSYTYQTFGIPSDLDDLLFVLFQLIYVLIEDILNPLVKISAWLLDGALNLISTSDTTIVNSGWTTSLSIANLFFMILLLAIAGATILGFEKFNYKKALPPFLMVALLINFSLTIGNSIIGTTNIFANFFKSTVKTAITGDTSISEKLANALKITAPEQKQREIFLNKIKQEAASISSAAPGLITFLIFNILTKLIVTFVNIAGAVFMLYRTFWLWLLLILAPLAWIAYAFPAGSKINQQWSKWWGEFIRWSLFAPLYLFFTYLGVLISKNTFTPLNITSDSVDMSVLSFATIMQMGAVLFIMLAGVVLSDKIGGSSSNFVVNYAKKSGQAASKKFKSFMPSQTYGQQLGEAAARRAGSLLTLGGRVSVPGVVDRNKYRTVQSKESFDKAKERYENDPITSLVAAANIARATGRVTPDQAAQINLLLSRHDNERTTVRYGDAALNSLIADPLGGPNIPLRNILRRAVAQSLR